MTEPVARVHIPETWAAQGHCPVCRAGPLIVLHSPPCPDRLSCGRCQTVFELEQDGSRLRLTRWPPLLTAELPGVPAAWFTRAEIKTAVMQVAHSPTVHPAAPVSVSTPDNPAPVLETPPLTAADEPTALEPPPAAVEAATVFVEGSEPFAPPGAPEPGVDQLPDPRQFVASAMRLYALGNKPTVIRAALKNAGAEPEQIDMALAEVFEQDRKVRLRQRLQLQLASAAAAITLIGLAGVFLSQGGGRAGAVATPAAPASAGAGSTLPAEGVSVAQVDAGSGTETPLPYNPIIDFINNWMPKNVWIENGPSPTPRPTWTPAPTESRVPTQTVGPGTPLPPTETPAPTNASGLPAWALTLAPPGATLVGVATPQVEQGIGPGANRCPQTPREAAKLFGGEPAQWSQAMETNGWILIVAGDPVTVYVPANMRLGYMLIGQTLQMTSVGGPATVHNINFAAITCE